jgi:alpha-tubulin suppressor-like RCC1 family protein
VKTHRFSFLARTNSALAIVLLCATTGRAQNVIAWGINLQNPGQTNVPASATNVIAVATGEYHSLALRSNGTVLAWGSGTATNVPAKLTNATAIASGLYHSLALRADGSVVAWGDNYSGVTNVPATATNVIALAAGWYHNLALRADGTVVAWGRNVSGQTNVPASLSNVAAITAGAEHSMALGSDGSLTIWGGSAAAPLSFAATRPPWTKSDILAISAADSFNVGLLPGGSVFTWGTNQPKIPASATNVVAVAVGTSSSTCLGLTSSGTLLAWGSGPATNVPPSATNIIAMTAGESHGLAVIGDGSPRILGGIAYRTRVSVGDPLPFFARAVGQRPLSYQWTSNGIPIGALNTALPQIPAVLGNDDAAYQVIVTNSLGAATSAVARVTVQSIKLWGRNTDGQCNIPDSVTNPVCIAAGGFHSLALNGDGTMTAWGKNWDGQMTLPAAVTNAVAVAAGWAHSLALKADGSVLAWGCDWDGQTDVPTTATNVVAVAAGWAHSLALKADGTVVAWGNDDYGQTDSSWLAMNVVAIAAGYYHNIALRSDGLVTTWGWDLPVPPDATNVVAVAAGWQHCLALRADGSVIAWGDNTYGETTVPASATNVVAIAAAWYDNLALRADGTVVAWGRGNNGVTSVPAGLRSVVSIAAGEDYNVAVVGTGVPQFGPQLASVAAHLGGATVLSANVQGSYPLTFQWYHDGNVVAGATNRFLWLPGCQATDAGDYVLVASNASGQATNQPVHLAVRADPISISAIGAWGDNISGQCAVSHGVANPRAIATGASHALALNADGTVAAWGKNWDGQTNVPFTLGNVVAIAAGGNHSLALRGGGSVVAWGSSDDGLTDFLTWPGTVIQCGGHCGRLWAHSLALEGRTARVVAWGNNEFHQTNNPRIPVSRSRSPSPRAITTTWHCSQTTPWWLGAWRTLCRLRPRMWSPSAGGWWHSLALRADGTVVAWGDNSYGQCAVPPDPRRMWSEIAAGYYSQPGLAGRWHRYRVGAPDTTGRRLSPQEWGTWPTSPPGKTTAW